MNQLDPAHAPGFIACDDRVRTTLVMIEATYADPNLSLAKAAEVISVSASRLSHLLTQHTGASFNWHLHKKRTDAAAALLRESPLAVKEIVAKVGYKNILTLERHFQSFFGCAPRDYRKRGKSLGAGVAPVNDSLASASE